MQAKLTHSAVMLNHKACGFMLNWKRRSDSSCIYLRTKYSVV